MVTFYLRKSPNGLDRIYVRGFDIERAHALTGREWAQRSDHVPLLAELARP